MAHVTFNRYKETSCLPTEQLHSWEIAGSSAGRSRKGRGEEGANQQRPENVIAPDFQRKAAVQPNRSLMHEIRGPTPGAAGSTMAMAENLLANKHENKATETCPGQGKQPTCSDHLPSPSFSHALAAQPPPTPAWPNRGYSRRFRPQTTPLFDSIFGFETHGGEKGVAGLV